jgi:uncharacterized protein
MERPLYTALWDMLSKYSQMIFISGPRQSGKTTFAKILGTGFTNYLYFNWDILDHKRKLIENPNFYEEMDLKDDSVPLLVLDELHKYADWKNTIKSIYDRDKERYKIIVSGSGRLDLYQKGGDSLAGRYFLLYLWPFTLAELCRKNRQFNDFIANPAAISRCPENAGTIWKRLTRFSGFPDPYINENEQYYKVWSNTYKKQLLREDIRNVSSFQKFDNVEILFSLLPSKIGSPLSMANLARDIHVSFDTVKKWIGLFENLFLIFRISPWHNKIPKAITKEKKLYLFDYAALDNIASKFENMVALELLRAVSNWRDSGYGEFTLHYVRNRAKQEVDFLIALKNQPLLLIETKLSDTSISKALLKFQNLLNVPAVQLVNKSGVLRFVSNGHQKILLISADHWLALLP